MVRGAFGSICRRYNYYEKIMKINKIKVKFLVVAYPALEFNGKVILTDILEDPIQLITEAATYHVNTQLFYHQKYENDCWSQVRTAVGNMFKQADILFPIHQPVNLL